MACVSVCLFVCFVDSVFLNVIEFSLVNVYYKPSLLTINKDC